MANSGDGLLPPRRTNPDGAPRRVGVELEFSGLGVEVISTLVAAELGGHVERTSAYEHRVLDSRLGTVRVELDFAFLLQAGRDAASDEEPERPLITRLSEEMLAAIAPQVVPFEVVLPPIPIDRIAELDPLVAALRDAGALGTRHAAVYAFGLHLNPELPDLETATILDYLRGFLCLDEWLRRAGRIDWSRRMTPYIQPFPKPYVKRVLDPGYQPAREAFVDDYLAANPERNRALDLLPLLCEIDEPRVRAAVDDPRVKPRPALHYRLPNCDVDQPGWGVTEPWRHWLEVERLAADPQRLHAICRRYLEILDSAVGSLITDWPAECDEWLRGER